MSKNQLMISNIENRIFTIRGIPVMIDKDLAEMYQVQVKRLNEQVKRNINRFPNQFRFELTNGEKNELVANCDRFKNLKHSSVNPFAFTEQGVAMLSAVLKSDIAIQVSI
jgi:ORF6N domain